MKNGINWSCDDCPVTAAFKSRKAARDAGWALAGDYEHCYCPKHAPLHRFGAATKANDRGQLPPGFTQLKIENLG